MVKFCSPLTDGSQTSPLQSNIYHYMPHLRQHSDSLLPNVVLGKGRHGGKDRNTNACQ